MRLPGAWSRGAALRLSAAGEVLELVRARGTGGDLALLPGLVDAHAHLELTPPARLAPPARAGTPFGAWIAAVLAWRAGRDRAALGRAAARGARMLLASGTVAVGEIESAGASRRGLRAAGLPGRLYREVIGPEVEGRRAARAALASLPPAPDGPASGLSPHAPYTVSPDLLRACREAGVHLAVHAAETEEEVRFLRDGTGPLRELLEARGRLPAGFRPPRCSPVRFLERSGLLGPRTLLIHAHHLGSGDAERIARAGSPVAVCPGTIRFFARSAPPLRELMAAGVTVALGTDSLLSNEALSMVREMALLREAFPDLAPGTVLRMASRAGWKALDLPRPRRSFLLVPALATEAATVDAFTAGALEVAATIVEGRLAHGSLPRPGAAARRGL